MNRQNPNNYEYYAEIIIEGKKPEGSIPPLDTQLTVYKGFISAESINAAKTKFTQKCNETELFAWRPPRGKARHIHTGKDLKWKEWNEVENHLDRKDLQYITRSAESISNKIMFENRGQKFYGDPTTYHVYMRLYWNISDKK